MEVAAEIEDDLFFADLSKQISLLIMDDDDDDEDPLANCSSVSLHQAFSGAIHPPGIVQTQFVYHEQISCRRESKGTGVFIPQQTQPRRNNNNNKHRQGRIGSSYHAKSQRQVHLQHDNTKKNVLVSHQQVPSSGSYKPKFSKGS